ncbi:MAG: TonB-dependent receptor plug domain-containing protein [Chryseolinea sp.]
MAFSREKDGTFTAHSEEPLEIENLYLGYKVYYDLELLTYNLKNFSCKGNVRFEEINTTDTLMAKQWTKNRRYAYAGSLNHFLKSVISKNDVENGYATYSDITGQKEIARLHRFTKDLNQTIAVYKMKDKVQRLEDSIAFIIKLPRRLEIQYQRKYVAPKIYVDINNPISWIEMRDRKDLLVNHDGSVLNPDQMLLSGHMLDERVAHLLPSNYHPDLTKLIYRPALAFKPGQLNNFAEKSYVQTDRAYYYPGETLWFKSYMIYALPAFRDSLSRVLHVDIVDSKNSVVAYKACDIKNGMSIGDIPLDSHLGSGDYTLRAYTRWMLNFDTAFVFKKSIKILSLNESVRTEAYEYSGNEGISISTNKGDYNPRESIDVTITPMGELGDTLKASLSISVTDLNQAQPAVNESGITSSCHLPEVAMNALDKNKFLAIQKGFDLSGRFVSGKNHTLAHLIFVEAGLEKTFTVTTKTDGTFFIPDLLVYDTARLSYIAKVPNGRYGSITYDTTHVSAQTSGSRPLALNVYSIPLQKRVYKGDVENGTTLLKSITISENRIADSQRSFGTVDYTVDGNWLRERNPVDILYAIQSRVPGLRILTRVSDGVVVRILQFLGPGSIRGSEPLVLIDGIALDDSQQPLADQISALTPDMVERVDVTLYGNSAIYGARGAGGVIAIVTRRPGTNTTKHQEAYDLRRKEPLNLKGFSRTSKFSSADYSNPEQNKDIPDDRTTLYWNPSLETDGKQPLYIKFWAADLPTRYRIVVEGITADGRAIRGEKIVVVKK